MQRTLKGICISMAAAGLIFGAVVANASTTFQGVTFTFTVVDSNTLQFEIDNALNADPDWDTATHLGAFSLKDLGLDFTTVTATANGPGGPITGVKAELNNSGASADCAVTGETGSICFDISPDV